MRPPIGNGSADYMVEVADCGAGIKAGGFREPALPELPAGCEIELPDPAARLPLKGTGIRNLANRVAQQVRPECDTRTRHATSIPVAEPRPLSAGPRHTRIAKERDLDRNRTIHAPADAKRAKQRESELQVGHRQAAAGQPIDHVAAARRGDRAVVL